MKSISISKNKTAIVDDEDYDKINKYKWQARWSVCTKSYYANSKIYDKITGKQQTIIMSRIIMGLQRGDKRQIDHLNHDTLDNRKENLKACSPRENAANRKNKSKYGIGICFDKKNKKNPYRYRVRVKDKMINVGQYDSVEKAQKAREDYIKRNNL